jgi:hypothetical protein
MGKRSAVVELLLGNMGSMQRENGLLCNEKISRPWQRNLSR